MDKIRTLLLWLWMLNKRQYKKPVFLVVLVLIPALVFGYRAAAREDSGVLTVALAQESSDALAAQIMDTLVAESPLIHYRVYPTPEAAEAAVRMGKADAAWIFPDGMREKMEFFLQAPSKENAFVRVIEQESNVMLKMTHEKLGGILYRFCSQTVYLNYIRSQVPEMAHLSNEALLQYYHGTGLTDTLFIFEHAGGAQTSGEENYLLAPVRGLLAVIISLSAMAASMYFIRDSRLGVFSRIPVRERPLAELGCMLVPTGNLCVAALVSMLAAGLSGPFLRELLTALLYSLCVSGFCMLLRQLCGSVKAMATLLPLMAVVMLLVCPVFFDLGFLRKFQYLLPPTYYINGIYNSAFLAYMALYTLCVFALYYVIGKLKRRNP